MRQVLDDAPHGHQQRVGGMVFGGCVCADWTHPTRLTINGKSEIVVQDVASHQRLLEMAERAEQTEITRRAVAEMQAGQGRPAEEILTEMRKILAEKRGR